MYPLANPPAFARAPVAPRTIGGHAFVGALAGLIGGFALGAAANEVTDADTRMGGWLVPGAVLGPVVGAGIGTVVGWRRLQHGY